MHVRILPWISALALLVSAVAPVVAHDDQHGPGWHGQSLADEIADQFLADAQPAQDLAAQSAATCVNGSAAGYPCSNVNLLSFLPLGDIGCSKGNDVWGWTDPSGSEREFALMGCSTGTAFVEITDPVNPVYLGNLPTTRFSSTWRDIKVYADHAFVVSEALNHGMQVFDLTRLLNVASPPVTFSEDAHYSGISTAHNLVINEGSGYAYIVGSNQCSGGLHMVNIQNPTSPTEAGCFSADGYTHDAQCVNYAGPDGDYSVSEICFASNEDTLTIVDVSIKSAPVQLARVSYPGVEYTHQGWLTEDQRYFLIDDELDENRNGHNTRTIVFDLLDLDAPLFVGANFGMTAAIDHNQYVVGNHTFQANYRAGLRILDITRVSSASLPEVAYFDIYPANDAAEFNGAWSTYPFFGSGTVVVSGIEQGLFVLKPNLGGNMAPSVTLDQPAEGATVKGVEPIAITASDLEDAAGTLTVEWNVDGGTWQLAGYDTETDTYTASWDSTTIDDGTHILTARATDSNGASTTDSNAVSVDNVAGSVHVGDLDGTKNVKGKSGRWEAFVTVTVHDDGDALVADATVTGTWSGAASGTISGVTAGDGTVTFSTGTLSGGDSATFTVDNISHTSSYDETKNHDPDGDSIIDGTGTRITVTKT